eukprot:9587619-Prorocentrum_lima.AAC.1
MSLPTKLQQSCLSVGRGPLRPTGSACGGYGRLPCSPGPPGPYTPDPGGEALHLLGVTHHRLLGLVSGRDLTSGAARQGWCPPRQDPSPQLHLFLPLPVAA